VDWIEVPVSEATWDGVLESYLDCYDLDVAKYDAVISTKNPTFMVRHPNHICWLIHQLRAEMLRFLLKSIRFEKVEIQSSSPANLGQSIPKLTLSQPWPDLDRFNQVLEQMNTLLFGWQDYAVVGYR
jgi:hypothetical protein